MAEKTIIDNTIKSLRQLYWHFVDNKEMREARRLDTIIGKLIALYELDGSKYK